MRQSSHHFTAEENGLKAATDLKLLWQQELKSLGSLSILVVDDDPVIVSLLRRVIVDLEIGATYTAETGAEALQIIDKESIDVLLTDIQMPIMGGLELLKKIRCGESSAPRNLRTIMFTSTSPSDTLGTAIRLDVNGFIPKPFTAEAVLQKVLLAMADSESNILDESEYAQIETSLSVLIRSPQDVEFNTEARHQPQITELKTARDWSCESVFVYQLKEGMELAEDINTAEGMPLLKAGCVIDQRKVQRLLDIKDLLASAEILVTVPQ